MKVVEIFKTNVQNDIEADKLVNFLLELNPVYKINFDLEDEDKILRVEVNHLTIDTDKIIKKMIEGGYNCEKIE
ncbi:methyltransferase type 11 [Pseudopedobacter sp.]|uniref:methyltransferase type 11 n=1 Tax=Pseudopedobacter sp. TaxID=1936787 RepID=UPI0033429BEA